MTPPYRRNKSCIPQKQPPARTARSVIMDICVTPCERGGRMAVALFEHIYRLGPGFQAVRAGPAPDSSPQGGAARGDWMSGATLGYHAGKPAPRRGYAGR